MAETDKIKKLQAFKHRFNAEKVIVPNDLDDIIKSTDEICRLETIDNLSSVFKEAFLIFSAALSNTYKNTINENRRKTLKNAKTDGGLKTRLSSGSNKLPRESTVPESYKKCRSPTAMAALVLFYLCNEKSQIRKNMLFAALSGEFKNASEALRAISDSKHETAYEEPPIDMLSRIIQALLECAEITKDKNPAKLAMDMNEHCYNKAAEYYLKRKTLKTMYPFEPLRLKYLKGCVGQLFMKIEYEKLTNQHKIDPQRTIQFLLDNVDRASCAVAKNQLSRRTRSVSVRFDPEKQYTVFVGPINYLSNLMITNYKNKGRIYRIVTYNDCLYDVIGSHLEDCNGQDQNADSQIYTSLTWQDRLNLLPYRAKIELRFMTGQELNDFQGHAMLTVSWMESGLENSKTFEMRSDRKKHQE